MTNTLSLTTSISLTIRKSLNKKKPLDLSGFFNIFFNIYIKKY